MDKKLISHNDHALLQAKYRALLPEANRVASQALSAGLALLSLADAIFDDCRQRLTQAHLSEGRFAVLLLLHQARSPLTPSALAEQAEVTRATMTGLLDSLVRDGLIRRESVAADRRRLAISLTSSGQKTLARILPRQLHWLESLFGNLTPAEENGLRHCLEKIGANVQTARRPSAH